MLPQGRGGHSIDRHAGVSVYTKYSQETHCVLSECTIILWWTGDFKQCAVGCVLKSRWRGGEGEGSRRKGKEEGEE